MKTYHIFANNKVLGLVASSLVLNDVHFVFNAIQAAGENFIVLESDLTSDELEDEFTEEIGCENANQLEIIEARVIKVSPVEYMAI